MGCCSCEHNKSPWRNAATIFSFVALFFTIGTFASITGLVVVVLLSVTTCCGLNKAGLVAAAVIATISGSLSIIVAIFFDASGGLIECTDDDDAIDDCEDFNADATRMLKTLYALGAFAWFVTAVMIFKIPAKGKKVENDIAASSGVTTHVPADKMTSA